MISRAEAEETLTRVARDGSGEARARVVEALGAVGGVPGALTSPTAQQAVGVLISSLLSHAEPEQRARLSEALAPEAWLPDGVAEGLAAEALSTSDSAALLAGLAANPGLGATLLARLAEVAETAPWVRIPLARHPALTETLAGPVHTAGGAALRRELDARFPGLATARARPSTAPVDDPEALVAKLHAAGQLGPGKLLRFLRDDRLDLFQTGAAVLTGRARAEIETACADPDDPAFHGLAKALGLDRAVVPEVAAHLRALRRDAPVPSRFSATG